MKKFGDVARLTVVSLAIEFRFAHFGTNCLLIF